MREEGDATLVFEKSAGRICVMNETSAFILGHCTAETSIDDLAELLRKNFDFSQFSEGELSLLDVVRQHVELLRDAGLLDAVDAGKS